MVITSYRITNEAELYYDSFDNVKTLELGIGCSLYVFKNDKPYLCVKVEAFSSFTDAVIFGEHLYIGNYTNGLYIIDLKAHTVRNMEIDEYFGYFHQNADRLYVLGCSNITAFDVSSHIIWESEYIAVDGIVFNDIVNNVMYVECEMNPPGGWTERKIDIITGKIII